MNAIEAIAFIERLDAATRFALDALGTDALVAGVEAVLAIHQRSFTPASGGDHKGRHYCMSCTTSVDDFTAYVDHPCATARALGVTE